MKYCNCGSYQAYLMLPQHIKDEAIAMINEENERIAELANNE